MVVTAGLSNLDLNYSSMFKLYKSDDKQYYFTVCSANHQPILTSETYKRKENALKGVASVCKSLGVKKANIIDLTNEKK